MQKIKILHLTSNLGIGGAARTIQSFIKYRNQNLFEESVCSLGQTGPRKKSIEALNAKVYVTNNNVEKVIALINEFQPDIIHLHYDGKGNEQLYQILNFAKLKNIRLIATNIFAYYDPKIDKLLDQHLFKSKMMLSIKFKKNSILHKLPFTKYKVLYNPVDTESFKKYLLSATQIKKEKQKLGIPTNHFIIGRVGRADVVKWGDLLLEAFPLILKEIPNTMLLLRGVPQSRIMRIEKEPWSHKVIILPESNNDKDVMSTYQLMDIYVHTTKIGEAFGNTLNEAMYFKKPIVTQSTPHCDNGQLEQVIHQQNGLIANYPETFAQAVIFLLKNKKISNQLGNNGYKKVTTEYNPKKTTHRLEKIYIRLINSQQKQLDKKLIHWAKTIDLFPTKQQISNYNHIYIKLLTTEFGSLNRVLKFKELLRTPQRLTIRIKDAYQHYYAK